MRAPTVCARPGCPSIATKGGRCAEHQRKPWGNQSPASRAYATDTDGRRQHRAARAAALRRCGGACEDCGHRPTPGSPPLELHHPIPIAHGGALVQADGRMLCPTCHRKADKAAGIHR